MDDRVRILQVSAYYYPHVGGSEWYCEQLSKRLFQRGHDVHVITSRFTRLQRTYEKRNGLNIHRVNCLGTVWNVNPMTIILHKILRVKADIVHAHSYVFFTSNQAAFAKIVTRVPLLLHLHGGIDCSPPTEDLSTRFKFFLKKKLYDPFLGKWTVRTADAVASVSRKDIKVAQRSWNIDEEKLHWVPTAVDSKDFDDNASRSDDQLRVVFIGRLESWKGIHTLLRIAELVQKERDDVDFLVVGDGSLKDCLLNDHGANNIKLLGRIPHTLIPNVLSQASVLVLPSYMEGMPFVALEALAAQVPVVATNVGGTSEIVIDGETGYLFSPGDHNLGANRVLGLLCDEKTRMRMGRRGKDLIEEHYTWDKVVRKIEAIYGDIVN